jgi:plasmid maintenance system antidote protein VapI
MVEIAVTDPRFWLNLQAAHELSGAEKVHSYKKIVPRRRPDHSSIAD